MWPIILLLDTAGALPISSWALTSTHERLFAVKDTAILCLGTENTRTAKVLMPWEAVLHQGWIGIGESIEAQFPWPQVGVALSYVFYTVCQTSHSRINLQFLTWYLAWYYHYLLAVFSSLSLSHLAICVSWNLFSNKLLALKSLSQGLLLGNTFSWDTFQLLRISPKMLL